jgi:hypothetical protein
MELFPSSSANSQIVSVSVSTYGKSLESDRVANRMTEPDPSDALDRRLELDAWLMGYGWRVCEKLFKLDVRDKAAFLLLGVVGAVRYCCHVLVDSFRAGNRDRTLDAWLLADPDRERLLPGVVGFVPSGASLSMSLSDIAMASSSSSCRDSRTEGSSGSMPRRVSAKRCISSRKREFETGRVENRAYSYKDKKSVVVEFGLRTRRPERCAT